MLVYRDQTASTLSSCLVQRLGLQASQAEGDHPDERRDLLITAGQLEQGVLDLPNPDPWLTKTAMKITDLAAAVFLGHTPAGQFLDFLRAVAFPGNLRLRIKSPEGFAHYALFPEQYAQAAADWVQDHAGVHPKPVLVAGVRSIGTALSAAVAQTLKSRGWPIHRFTVRPTGHPYDRRVGLPSLPISGDTLALVVDEGPGRSGSSMAATASALINAGLERSQISFFPGHRHGPGPEATAAVRRIWEETPCYAAGLSEVKWKGCTLREIFAHHAGISPENLEDLSAGNWRRVHFANPRDWPAAWAPFERTKYRTGTVLWKFCGFSGAATESAERIASLAEQHWTVPPLSTSHGFMATPWIDGSPLRLATGREPQFLSRLGQYLAAAAGPPLSLDEAEEARNRLGEMIACNTREAFGEAMNTCGGPPRADLPSAGDGRLGPVEWIQDGAGRLYKVDCQGHSNDHMIPGRQPVLWDLAGAVIEWRLNVTGTRELIDSFNTAGQTSVRPADLVFYVRAYTAFRMGQSSLCAELADGVERDRLLQAETIYRSQLCHRRPKRPRE